MSTFEPVIGKQKKPAAPVDDTHSSTVIDGSQCRLSFPCPTLKKDSRVVCRGPSARQIGVDCREAAAQRPEDCTDRPTHRVGTGILTGAHRSLSAAKPSTYPESSSGTDTKNCVFCTITDWSIIPGRNCMSDPPPYLSPRHSRHATTIQGD